MQIPADERKARFFLNASDVFYPSEQEVLLKATGSASALLAEPRSVPDFIAREKIERFLKRADILEQGRIYERLAADGVSILLAEDASYPAQLQAVQCPPHLLYVRGCLPAPELPAFSIIGTRHPSLYGRQQAQRFAAHLGSSGMVIVSGLARGIDSVALKAATDAQAAVVGILGTGIDVTYPPENGALFAKVAQFGAVVSEFPPGAKPLKNHFPWRNRLISGWSLGLLVVEAALKSGTMGTVRWALDQGKDVFALPGPVSHENSRGCHKMIKEGAYLAEHPEDILEHFQQASPAPHPMGSLAPADEAPLTPGESNRCGVGRTPLTIEELLENSTMEYVELTRALNQDLALGLIARLPGARYVLKK